MADITSQSVGSTTVGANYNVFSIVNGTNGKTTIISASKTNMTNAEVATLVKGLTVTVTAGTNDAFSVAGIGTADGSAFVSGTTDVIYIALQGTGVHTAGANWNSSGFTTAVVAVLQDKNNN